MTITVQRPAIDAATYRHVLAHVPSSVSVVTAADDDGAAGMTVGSFTSISLDPPLVGFFAKLESATADRVRRAGSFCVNVLADDQHEASRRFASKTSDRFAGIDVVLGAVAAPRLAGSVAWIECAVETVVELGDHLAVVGRVLALEVNSRNPDPMVFFRGGLRRLDRRALPGPSRWQLDHYADW